MLDIGKHLVVGRAKQAFAAGKFIGTILGAGCKQLISTKGFQEQGHGRCWPKAEADGVAHIRGDCFTAVFAVYGF